MSFPGRALQRAWHLVDANNQTVGRLATTVAPILRGKHKPTYSPNQDIGDYVVIINADKVKFTGKKWQDKLYRWHTGYPGEYLHYFKLLPTFSACCTMVFDISL
mmetsp:Transcript_177/g.235  ORF Transcript_177/g.235 Transcript_177/m.235 type:complete len:104 (-) Transcript_177:2584-2895(-)